MAASLSAATLAAIAQAVRDAMATSVVSAPVEPSAASAHFKARDIPCAAATPCGKTFKTVKGRDWHIANVKHA